MTFGTFGALAVVIVAAIAIYFTESHSAWPPSDAAVKRLLRQLPYRFEFRAVATPEGASGAVAGKVIGRTATVVNFGIALGGKGSAVPVPHAGTFNAVGDPGFVVTNDTIIRGADGKFESGKQFRAGAQWDEANRMISKIEETLCEANTGKPCPV